MVKDNPDAMTLCVTLGQYSGAGRKAENQDFHGAALPGGSVLALKGIALAVADGISSSPHSRQAAEAAVTSLLGDYYATPEAWSVETAGRRVILAINSWLWGQSRAFGPDRNRGLVCTLSALILKGREGHILHVGDSRVQRLTGGSLEPLTEDHRNILSSAESYLARALGAAETVEIDYSRVPLALGDVFLLTTDGVHEFIDGRTVTDALNEHPRDFDAAARAVAHAALARGSSDNLTVQIVRIDGLPAGAASDVVGSAGGLPIPPLPVAGDVIDGFRILRQIHASARSHVFLAVAPSGDRVTLKLPSTEHRGDAAWLGRFMLEEWVARRVSSPHVLAAPPLDRPRTGLYAVSNFVEGQTLRDWMADHPHPDLPAVRDIAGQIAAGLRALHRRDMIHQDLRPENVMMDADGTVKIIDLGSVTVAGVEEAAPGVLGEMPGTYQYTAPEYLSGDAVSWRSDQYALGVIVYELLTGRLPYGAQVARVRSRADQRRLVYRPARDDETGVPDWIDAALHRATNPDPLARYDALTEFLADLRRPGENWAGSRHISLAERNPTRFWQAVSVLLSLALLVSLATRGR